MAENNAFGINAFSGPMGEKEPAYGVAETMKVLGKIGVKNPRAVEAPRRARRAAGRKQVAPPTQTAIPPAPVVPPFPSYDQQVSSFWQQLSAEPGASPLVQQIAAQVGNGSSG